LVLWISTWHDLENVTAIVLGIWTVPTFALAKLQLEIARGVRQIMLAYVPSLIVYPLLLIGGAYFWFQEQNHLTSVNAIAAPLFASLYAKGDLQGLQRLVSTIARWIFLPALIVAIGLIQFAEPILGLFGAEFIAAKWVMAALAFGQLVNVGAGSVGYLLIMTGHHNQCAYVMGFSALGNLILNLIWIPQMGILGAALATSLSMALWNIWMNRLVVKYLGVDPSILAALKSPS
jgi:O-antigen/teichoic acid export membrane protein